jgi:hypothetical protein
VVTKPQGDSCENGQEKSRYSKQLTGNSKSDIEVINGSLYHQRRQYMPFIHGFQLRMEEKCWHMSTPALCAPADEGSKVQSVDAFFFYLNTNGAHYCHTNWYVELPWGSQDSLIVHVCIPLILIIELA